MILVEVASVGQVPSTRTSTGFSLIHGALVCLGGNRRTAQRIHALVGLGGFSLIIMAVVAVFAHHTRADTAGFAVFDRLCRLDRAVAFDAAGQLDVAAVALDGQREHVAGAVCRLDCLCDFLGQRDAGDLFKRIRLGEHLMLCLCLRLGVCVGDDGCGDGVDIGEQRRDHQTDGGEHRDRLYDVLHDSSTSPTSGLERVSFSI